MTSLAGKVALITGGAGGFGRAFVEKLISLGCKVCICDVNVERGEKEAESYGADNVKFVHCDVTCDKSFRAAFDVCLDTFGSIDIVINNAGTGNEKDFKASLDVNLGGVMRGTEIALERMSKAKGHGGGRIINVASIAGLKNIPFGPFYAATKSGIIHYSRAIGHPFHFNYTGVVVQCLCPSLVETPFLSESLKTVYNEQCLAAIKGMVGKVPLLKPSEIADALVKLIEDNKTGAVMVVEKDKEPYYVDSAIPS